MGREWLEGKAMEPTETGLSSPVSCSQWAMGKLMDKMTGELEMAGKGESTRRWLDHTVTRRSLYRTHPNLCGFPPGPRLQCLPWISAMISDQNSLLLSTRLSEGSFITEIQSVLSLA